MRDNGHHWPLCPTAKTLIRLMRRPLLLHICCARRLGVTQRSGVQMRNPHGNVAN